MSASADSSFLRSPGLGLLLRGSVSVALLAWLGAALDWQALLSRFGALHWELALLGLLPLLGNRLLTAWKWRILMRAVGQPAGYLYLLRISWIGNFFGHVLPSGVGGDAVRMVTVARGNARAAEAVSSVVVERLCGAASLGLLSIAGVVGLLLGDADPRTALVLLVPGAALLLVVRGVAGGAGWSLLRRALGLLEGRPGHGFLLRLLDALADYRNHRGAVAGALAISFLVQLTRITWVFCVTLAFDLGLSWWDTALVVPPALFASLLPISIAGFGVKEGAFALFFSTVAVAPHLAVGVALVARLVAILIDLPGAILFLSIGLRASADRG